MSKAATAQVRQPQASRITEAERHLGAPWPPLPPSFRKLPAGLDVADPPATAEEIALALQARKPFLFPGCPDPFMRDMVRAARLLRGARFFGEIGIYDRGNLAFLSAILAEDAVIIGVDLAAEPSRDNLLREVIRPGQSYHLVIGDSRAPETVSHVRDILHGEKLDAVFIDGGHDAYTVMHDYVNFSELVRDNGLVLFHDSLWEGNADYKGVADALSEIDKLDPVYLIAGDWPCHRFMRSLWREPIWGVVGVLPMESRFICR